MSKVFGPKWLAHRYDPTQDAIHLIEVSRADRRKAVFLTDEYLGTRSPVVHPRTVVAAARSSATPPLFIFHSAFCCSTLLAAALDVDGISTSFKEPVILNDVVGWLHRGGDRTAIAIALKTGIDALVPFDTSEAAVIKPSNVVNGLATGIMGLFPQARAILMYAPLRGFLASIARKGLWGRIWVRDLLSKQLIEGFVRLGFEQRDYLLFTDLQVAAVGWIAQHQLFADLATRWPNRVRTLDSEALVAEPAAHLAAAAALFGLTMNEKRIKAIVADVFARDAKDGQFFAPGQRAETARAGQALHADEIDKVIVWAEAVMRNAGVLENPGSPLIG